MQDHLASLTPQYWQFWIGLMLILLVLVGRDRLTSWTRPLRGLIRRLDWRGDGGRARLPAARSR